MILIGITGAIGHGKTSLAEALQKTESNSLHLETGMLIAEVADALHKRLDVVPKPDDIAAINSWLGYLPEIIMAVTNKKSQTTDIIINESDINNHPELYEKLFVHLKTLANKPDLAKQTITVANKANHRAFLQWLGGYLVVKVDKGIWYDELVSRLTTANKALGIISGVRFPSDADAVHAAGGIIVKIQRPFVPEKDAQDPTERERKNVKNDVTIINDGSLQQISRCAFVLLQNVRCHELAKIYRTSDYQ